MIRRRGGTGDRLVIPANPAWIEQLDDVASAMGYGSVAAYARVAIREKMEEDGYESLPPELPKKKRGRPKKRKPPLE